jgi:putative endonuclease
MTTNRNLTTGREGENSARRYLITKGYNILHTNWRQKRYEVDIVAEGNGQLVFVEVKTRDKNCLRPPATAVNRAKIARITAAADAYVRNYDVDKSVRFDVITVLQGSNSFKIDHIESAFYPPLTTVN